MHVLNFKIHTVAIDLLEHFVLSITISLIYCRVALEKMQIVCSQNPALGDPEVIQSSLEATHSKLDGLNADLYKFKVNQCCSTMSIQVYSSM